MTRVGTSFAVCIILTIYCSKKIHNNIYDIFGVKRIIEHLLIKYQVWC